MNHIRSGASAERRKLKMNSETIQPTSCGPVSFTLEDLHAARALIPPIAPAQMLVRPDIETCLRNAFPSTDHEIHFGIKIYVKPGQVMSAWMISDESLAKAYLSGAVTEADLLQQLITLPKTVAAIRE